LKHAQTCLYYEQVAWLPLSSAIKSFRERHSHTTYIRHVRALNLGSVTGYPDWDFSWSYSVQMNAGVIEW